MAICILNNHLQRKESGCPDSVEEIVKIYYIYIIYNQFLFTQIIFSLFPLHLVMSHTNLTLHNC